MTYCIPKICPLPLIEYSNYVCPDELLDKCLKFFGISKIMLQNKSRKREVLEPRQIITYILCKHTSLTLERIAHVVGNSDHTTVISTRNKVEDNLFTDRHYRARYYSLKEYLKL